MKTGTLKNAVIAVLLIVIGILVWLCFDSITEPRLTESMIEQTEEKVQVKTDAVRQILRKADTNAAEVAPRVKRHVDSLGSADVARELNALLQLSRVEDIEALAQTQPVERLHLVATDLATLYMRDCVDAMDDDTFALYLKYHFFLCERRDMIGASHHVLDVLRKRELTGQ